jgi:bifunctional UDP-N-acetylglucosamine pyrophosphorylase/glucosamine-1-phosphate N-acetyltransferase
MVITFTQEGLEEAMGINSRDHLARAEQIVQERLRQNLMEAGVTMLMPDSVYLGMDVAVGADTVLYPGVILEGKTEIGRACVLGPNTHVVDSTVGEECRIVSSMVEGTVIERRVTIGPYSHLRPGTRLGEGVHLGNFVEVKGSTLERGVHSGHFSYLGDAAIGENTNIGAGTITANYDRATRSKHRTKIGKNVFVGVDTMIVAPREIGDGAATGAGSVVTKDIPPNSLAVGVPARVIKKVSGEGSGVGDQGSVSSETSDP